MYGKGSQNNSDLFEKGTLNGQRQERTLGGAISVPYLDLGDSYTRIHRLKGHQAVFNISALYVLYVF